MPATTMTEPVKRKQFIPPGRLGCAIPALRYHASFMKRHHSFYRAIRKKMLQERRRVEGRRKSLANPWLFEDDDGATTPCRRSFAPKNFTFSFNKQVNQEPVGNSISTVAEEFAPPSLSFVWRPVAFIWDVVKRWINVSTDTT